jgi:hypothetical protein
VSAECYSQDVAISFPLLISLPPAEAAARSAF